MMQQELEAEASAELDAEKCWRAVSERDGDAGLSFVYAVRSTKIFCRPSCPSRRPRRENVRFFSSAEAAAAAQFRPCKRCRPEHDQTPQAARIEKACRAISSNIERPLPLETLSRHVGGSVGHLARAFKQALGVTPRQYAEALRQEQLKSGLQNGDSIVGARCEAGYGSSRGLYERAPSQLGMTPATYARSGKGARILFGTTPCTLGFVLVAATHKGICSVALGDAPEGLEADLRREFPLAEIQRDVAALQDHVQSVLSLLAGHEPAPGLPLDVQATAFQWRVWQELQRIGRGETRSYAQVAQSLGHPTAARAVARACATNPTALIVPCHRVVRGDGALSGYRWGLERKQKLLAAEKKEPPGYSEVLAGTNSE
jgi:AraC family transcriptional regulator of adaptative response/methylated-DNA-[protein]-cysteine methyltransferase